MSLKNKVKKMQVAPLGFTGAHALSYFPEEIAVITGNNVGLYFE